MQKHVRTRSRVRLLPADKPVQLSLPGIPEQRYPWLISLPKRLGQQALNHRYPLALIALILFLYLIGQGFVAGAIACGAGLYLINTGVDKHFGGYLDQRGNK